MPQVSENIPDALQPRVDAALTWFNGSAEAASDRFEVTGILDADETLNSAGDLRLILCAGDRCEQRTFRVQGQANSWEVTLVGSEFVPHSEKPQAELDPPPGVRSSWLDKALSQYSFVVLLFYRGFW